MSDQTPKPLVSVIMGSQSDWPTMKKATEILEKLKIPFEKRIVSAHRTPERLFNFAKKAKERGLKVIIAGAGGAAHLPGMVSSLTTIPVLGVPIESRSLSGTDSLLSIVQMPAGVPVGTLAIGTSGAVNAALLAASILTLSPNNDLIDKNLENFRKNQTDLVKEIPEDKGIENFNQGSNHVRPNNHNRNRQDPLIPPRLIIGILGGGQLAKMIILDAAKLGYRCCVFCPDVDSPSFDVAWDRVVADYDDLKALDDFRSRIDLVTYEFENVSLKAVEHLAKGGAKIHPSPKILSICQNRIEEKNFVNSVGIPTTNYASVESLEQLKESVKRIGLPAILKTNRGGYDGKGQIKIHTDSDLTTVWTNINSNSNILEAFVDFSMEISVIVARDLWGNLSVFPPVENRHENHILRETIVPAQISDKVRELAIEASKKIAVGSDLVGLIAVEMFVCKDDKILVNELAPRPHNSGHWTIEGCKTSQFEQLVRAITGLPLGSTELRANKITMKNILGFEIYKCLDQLNDEECKLHIYGKTDAKPGRKMGHMTKLFHSKL
eukprot:TRINITY_DN10211_c0_g1_i1.p1 TRINITY_DN10211_c0_g1~~TRINITY_DN10211_c0_g1_i1.p1  ORF type:complete len:551 (-),score=95.59 TRINITY_DN10211_c0_g1_i1:81-1733(-)